MSGKKGIGLLFTGSCVLLGAVLTGWFPKAQTEKLKSVEQESKSL